MYLFADDTVLLLVNEVQLQRVVDEFHKVCLRRKLKVNAGKSKVMVFERKEFEVCDFATPYRVELPAGRRCNIVLGGE